MDKQDNNEKDPKQKQWEDRVEIAKNKAKLAGHIAEEKLDDLSEDIKKGWEHTKNVAQEKVTEAKNTLDELKQKAKHRLDENLD